MTDQPLLTTSLHDIHVELGARMVPFAGYDMPVQYEGIIAEAKAVRTAAGMFDVSHMGRFLIDGQGARELLDWVHTANISEKMPVGRARYGLICKRDGGIIDDAIVYRLSEDLFMLIANAANAAKVLNWLSHWKDERWPLARITDSTTHMAMIAVQGPKAIEIVAGMSEFDPSVTKPFNIVRCLVNDRPALVARTGYTGEDGVEIMPHYGEAPMLWRALMAAGVTCCGLGARDTLRLEAGLPLHGSDIDETVNPVQAGLQRFVNMSGDFCGAEPIKAAVKEGPGKYLVGFRTVERGPVPRSHMRIMVDGREAGTVTSGGYSPTLDMNIGLGYLPTKLSVPGTPIQIQVRDKPQPAVVVPLPFYMREKP